MKKETRKKIGSIVIASTLLLGSNSVVLAKENNYKQANVQKQNTEITVVYNGEKIEFDQKPIMENDRTKVPFRKVFESMGCIVYYNDTDKKIMALTKEGDILTHTIGTNSFELNGEVKTYDSASSIINDRTLIPLRAVAEILNAKVDWDEKSQTVEIQKQEKQLDQIEKEVMMHVLDVNYNPKDTKRYIAYKKQHPELTVEQAIINVNMDLDRELIYTHGYGIGENRELMHYEPKEEDIEVIQNPDDFLVLINKFNSLPKDFESKNLVNFELPQYSSSYHQFRNELAPALRSLLDDSRGIGLGMNILLSTQNYVQADMEFHSGISEMRYDSDEAYVYNRFPQGDVSELRTGLSFIMNASANSYTEQLIYLMENGKIKDYQIDDYNVLKDEMDSNKKSEQWLKENAYKYGFIERYPKEKTQFTRYEYSPNFYRYVGVDIATQMHNENLCFEEYYAKYLNPVVNNNQYTIEINSTQKVLKKY